MKDLQKDFTNPSKATGKQSERETDRQYSLSLWERLASRGWSRRRNRQALGGTNEPTRKPSNASKLRQRAGVRVNPVRAAAFTLAEALIVIGVIGVVAALTLPLLYANINEKIRNTRIDNIEKKFKQGTDELMAVGHIKGYTSTLDFVKELSNYMKITSYCVGTELYKCLPYSTINLANNKTMDVKEIKSSSNFGLDVETWGEPVAFITGDGATFIIMYNKECDIDEGKVPLESTKCIAGVYDWNGSRGPNRFGVMEGENILPDIISIGETGLAFNQCSIKLKNGTCFVGTVKTPSPVSISKCEEMKKDGYGIQYCEVEDDYWAGAVLACGGVQNMPTLQQLSDLADYLYNKHITSWDDSKVNIIPERAAAINLTDNRNIWSTENNSVSACRRYFSSTRTAAVCGWPNWLGTDLRHHAPVSYRNFALCVDNS